ncbi:MAG: 13E12 repeat family protein [Actinomycetota bacterium]|nr:13E12 repeat family protein [Actinomycetota bacterium]
MRALEELPQRTGPELRNRAEAHLIAEAGHFDPRKLRILGRRVLELVAPEVAEAQEYQLLLAEEQHARRATRLAIHSRADGTCELRGVIPDRIATRLRTYLDAISSPRRCTDHDRTGDPPRLIGHRRLGEAFCARLERLPEEASPRHGAVATTVMVLIDLDQLRTETGVGELGGEERLTAGEVRRMACNARLLPAETNLADGVLLCWWHHHRAHDHPYEARRLPTGGVRFIQTQLRQQQL